MADSTSKPLPTLFISHGGGPMPLLGEPNHASMVAWWKKLPTTFAKPRVILVVSGHWEEDRITVYNGLHEHSNLLYDYFGFPAETYQYEYKAPGSPETAAKIGELLTAAGIEHQFEGKRGYDHGVFVPLLVMYPAADIPVVQVSLSRSMDPRLHLNLGKALAPLRREGVLIIGSGMSFHNLRAILDRTATPQQLSLWSGGFDQWLQDSCCNKTGDERVQALEKYKAAPFAKECHAHADHLSPLFIAAGAALDDAGSVKFHDVVMNAEISSLQFG